VNGPNTLTRGAEAWSALLVVTIVRSIRPQTVVSTVIQDKLSRAATPVVKAGVCMQRMQKALTEMNLQLTTVLSDLSGVTGMSIIRSIVAGERDGMRLAEFRELTRGEEAWSTCPRIRPGL
jgi:2-C-methyl-D-erythritol 4-phosphate cytidylyltransferase